MMTARGRSSFLLTFSSLLGLALAGAGPPSLPMDLKVATTAGETVTLGSLVDPGKATVIHLLTDQCAISAANLATMEKHAADHENVKFIAILRFMNGVSLKEFECDPATSPANRGCEADAGETLNAEAANLAAGSKVHMVQDLFKNELAAGGGGGCADEVSNCADMGMTKDMLCPDEQMGPMCKKWCGKCPAEEPAAAGAAAFEPPKCCPNPPCNSCGAVWNQYGSTGDLQSAWDLKEQISTYAPGGCFLEFVASSQEVHPAKEGKVWSGEKLTKIENAVSAASQASAGECGAPGGDAPKPEATTTTATQDDDHDDHDDHDHDDHDDHDGDDAAAVSDGGAAPRPGCEPEEAPADAGGDMGAGDPDKMMKCMEKCELMRRRRLSPADFKRILSMPGRSRSRRLDEHGGDGNEMEKMCKAIECMKGEADICGDMMKMMADPSLDCICSPAIMQKMQDAEKLGEEGGACHTPAGEEEKSPCEMDAKGACMTGMLEVMDTLKGDVNCGSVVKGMECSMSEEDLKCVTDAQGEVEASADFGVRRSAFLGFAAVAAIIATTLFGDH